MADTAPSFKTRSIYSFELYPVPILGAGFQNVTIMGTIDEESARANIATQELHAQVYPFLPAGTPDDPNGYDYIRIRTLNGDVTAVGIPWIKPDSVALIDSKTADVVIGDITTADVPKIRNILVQAGFKNLSITLRN